MRVEGALSTAMSAAAILLSALPVEAAGRRISFEEYQALSEEARQRLLRRYVRRSGGYWEVSLDSYLVHTDVSAEYTLGLAVKMDEFYRRFTKIFIGRFRRKARPELFALKESSGYRSAVGRWSDGYISVPAWSVGMFAYVGSKFALFGCAERGEEKLHETLFHEGTHQLLHFYIGREIPRWFNEGVATNFQDWDVSLNAERNIYEGIWKSHYPRCLYAMATGKGDVKRKPDLMALMSSTEDHWLRTADPTCLYAEGWGFVNFLLTYGKLGRRNFNILITAFRSGRDPRKILPPRDRAALAGLWDRYIAEIIAPHCEFSLPVGGLLVAGKTAAAEKVLAEGLGKHPENNELLFFKGFLALGAGKPEEAYETLKPLEVRHPRHPLLMRTLGGAALQTGDRSKAAKWLKAAVAEDYRDEEAKKLLKEASKLRPR